MPIKYKLKFSKPVANNEVRRLFLCYLEKWGGCQRPKIVQQFYQQCP